MLNKYWHSSALALTIRPSFLRLFLYIALILGNGVAIFLVFSAGYRALAAAMILVLGSCIWWLVREPYCGASIGWRNGQWFLFSDGELTAVDLDRGWISLNWLIKITLREPVSGRSYPILLFADSAEKEAMRRLRCRLTLQR